MCRGLWQSHGSTWRRGGSVSQGHGNLVGVPDGVFGRRAALRWLGRARGTHQLGISEKKACTLCILRRAWVIGVRLGHEAITAYYRQTASSTCNNDIASIETGLSSGMTYESRAVDGVQRAIRPAVTLLTVVLQAGACLTLFVCRAWSCPETQSGRGDRAVRTYGASADTDVSSAYRVDARYLRGFPSSVRPRRSRSQHVE